jgi:hypothetical protein
MELKDHLYPIVNETAVIHVVLCKMADDNRRDPALIPSPPFHIRAQKWEASYAPGDHRLLERRFP